MAAPADNHAGGQTGGGGIPDASSRPGLEKHLEMIQAVITRMAGNSFAAKGWSVGAATALVAFAAQAKNPLLTLVALLPALAFWRIDAYFLDLERRYRDLYNAVVADLEREPPLVPRYLLNPYWLDQNRDEAADASQEEDGRPQERQGRTPSGKQQPPPWRAPGVGSLHGGVVAAVILVTLLFWAFGNKKPDPSPVTVKDTVNVRVLPPPATVHADTGLVLPAPTATETARGGKPGRRDTAGQPPRVAHP